MILFNAICWTVLALLFGIAALTPSNQTGSYGKDELGCAFVAALFAVLATINLCNLGTH